MSAPIIATKLYIPPPRAKIILRPSLIERLNEGLYSGRNLTLISAPAGFGKTTLLSEFVSRLQQPVAWVSLDDGDNDPVRFWSYLIAACQMVHAGIGASAQVMIESPQPLTEEAIITILINDIASLDCEIVLVLDDYHAIRNENIHGAFVFLLEHLPRNFHPVVSTRVDPPWPLARLRARRQLTEIRAEHLRLTISEAASFLDQVMGLKLSDQVVAALEARTEGWVAGLQLVALSLQRREDIDSFISAFTGSYRYIADYLVEEVLNRQTEMVQDFLLETSILDRMNADLCNTVAGRADAQLMLEFLERSNLFLVPLDEKREWYRYHHLFADLLRVYLVRLRAGQVPLLQCRASEWYARQGMMEEAIIYALRANDFERAAQMIEQFAATLSGQGRIETLSQWIGALPEAMVARRPRLGFSMAWALFFQYKFDQTRYRIQQIEQNLSPEEWSIYQGELSFWHGVLARQNHDLDRSRDFLLQALELLTEENRTLKAEAWIFLGLIYFEFDLRKASEAFAEANVIFEAKRLLAGVIPTLYFLAMTQRLQGQLGKADSTSQRALHVAEQMSHWPTASYAHLARAEWYYERNELESAGQHIAKGMELARLGGNADTLYIATLDSARLQRARRNWHAAQELIEQAMRLARSTISLAMVDVVDEQVCLFLAQGKIDEAAVWLQQNQTISKAGSLVPYLHEQIIWARVRVALGEAREALMELRKLLEQARNLGLLYWSIQIHCLQALALKNLGRSNEALNQLKSALDLAEQGGYTQVFLLEGLPMLELLHLAQKRGSAPGSVSSLIAAFAGHGLEVAGRQAPAKGILSQRELELLALIAAGHSNQEIARELVISIGTVKRHVANIFTKLEAHNRTEAVARARQLQLLSKTP